MKGQTDKLYQGYTKSVEETNALIVSRKGYFSALVESMIQIEESRIGFVKGLIVKNLKCTEQIAQSYSEKIVKMEAAVAAIDSQADIQAFTRDSDLAGENPIFAAVKCTPYEYE